MKLSLTRIFLGIIFCFSSSAFACSFAGLQYEVKFSENSSSLGAIEARKLAEWFIDWRDGIGISYGYVFSNSIPDDRHTQALAASRLENIQRLLEPLNKERKKIRYGNADFERVSKEMWPYFLSVATVGIQPLCAETNTCCGGRYR